MFLRHLSLLALCAPAGETPESATPGTATAPAVETPLETPPAKPGVFARAEALLRGSNGNAATIATLRSDLTARDTTIADLTAQLAARDLTLADLNNQITVFKASETQLQAAITALETERTDVQTEVIHQLAAANLPEAALPQTSTTALSATPAELWAQADAESNPVAKGKLAAQAMKLTAGKIHGNN